MQLRDDDNAGLVGGVYDIANIHKSHTGAAVNRRFDVAIIEIDLSSLGGGFRFLRVRHSSIVVLLRYYISRAQISLPFQRYLIQRGLRFCLVERRLIRLWIDNGEQIARFYILAFRKIDLHKRAIDSCVHCDGIKRLYSPQPVEIDRHVFLLDLACDNRHWTSWPRTTSSRTPCRRRLIRRTPMLKAPPSSQKHECSDDSENETLRHFFRHLIQIG